MESNKTRLTQLDSFKNINFPILGIRNTNQNTMIMFNLLKAYKNPKNMRSVALERNRNL
jgi:hypothetical protein